MKTSKAASCDEVDAASRPEVFELVPDLSQGPGELRLSTHVDREIVFPGHTIGARIDGCLGLPVLHPAADEERCDSYRCDGALHQPLP